MIVLKPVDLAQHLLDADRLNVGLPEETAEDREESLILVRGMLRGSITKVLEGRRRCPPVFRVQRPAPLFLGNGCKVSRKRPMRRRQSDSNPIGLLNKLSAAPIVTGMFRFS